ncbi:LysR family transcriptional regulator [Sphingomonas sp. RB3P16]|uniref:LysR family transcriptional regulator n=1 Tax=Parasphingomonas frigoris TaxID=3096163 RepID=UPI002FCABCA5
MSTAGLTELNAVAAVATHKNFRAAARELGVSASALSHAVAGLEQRLGVRLFNRTTRSVSTTDAGQQFLTRIIPAMREIADAMAEANDQRSRPTGLLRINTSEGAGEQIIEPIVLAFMRQYPEMRVEIVTDGRLVDIVSDGFDAGLRLRDMVPQDMIAVPVGPAQRHVVVAAPTYLEGRSPPKSPSDLKEHSCIRYRLPGGTLYRWEFERHQEVVTVEVEGPLTLTSDRLILRAVVAGAGIAYVNEWNAREALRDGRLIQLLDQWTPEYPGLYFYYPPSRHMRAGMRAFIDLLRDHSK